MKTIDKFFAPMLGALFLVTSFFAGCFPNANAQITPPYYNPANVRITGGTINGVTLGATAPASGAFSTLSSTGAATLDSAKIGGSSDLYLTRYDAKQLLISGDGVGTGVNAGLILGYHGTSGAGAIWPSVLTPTTSNFALYTNNVGTVINGRLVA